MSGYTLMQTYNNIFTQNYQHFVNFAQQDADLVHHVYLKIHNNFSKLQDFTGRTINDIRDKIYAYTKSSIYNTFLTQKRLEKHQLNAEDCQYQIEVILQQQENLNDDLRSEQQQLEYISEKLFSYIKKYSEAEQYIFTCYYLYDKNKRLTYSELSKISGYSISKVCGIIQKMKADLKLNLQNYINNYNDSRR